MGRIFRSPRARQGAADPVLVGCLAGIALFSGVFVWSAGMMVRSLPGSAQRSTGENASASNRLSAPVIAYPAAGESGEDAGPRVVRANLPPGITAPSDAEAPQENPAEDAEDPGIPDTGEVRDAPETRETDGERDAPEDEDVPEAVSPGSEGQTPESPQENEATRDSASEKEEQAARVIAALQKNMPQAEEPSSPAAEPAPEARSADMPEEGAQVGPFVYRDGLYHVSAADLLALLPAREGERVTVSAVPDSDYRLPETARRSVSAADLQGALPPDSQGAPEEGTASEGIRTEAPDTGERDTIAPAEERPGNPPAREDPAAEEREAPSEQGEEERNAASAPEEQREEMAVTALAAGEDGWITVANCRITHYCACWRCCGKSTDSPDYGVTSSGTHVREGRTVAVDPRVIPIGSEVRIGDHVYIAEDTGVTGSAVDIYVSDHARAWHLGTYRTDVQWRRPV